MLKELQTKLKQNIIWHSNGVEYLLSGKGHLRSIWVRDAALCSPALLKLGKSVYTFNFICLYLSLLDSANTPILALDTTNPRVKFCYAFIKNNIPCLGRFRMNTVSAFVAYPGGFESHLLVLMAFYYCTAKEQEVIKNLYAAKLDELLLWYDTEKNETGFLYSWGEKNLREKTEPGVYFFVNLLYWFCLKQKKCSKIPDLKQFKGSDGFHIKLDDSVVGVQESLFAYELGYEKTAANFTFLETSTNLVWLQAMYFICLGRKAKVDGNVCEEVSFVASWTSLIETNYTLSICWKLLLLK